MRFRRLYLRLTVFAVFVCAAVVVLVTAGSLLSSLATPSPGPRPSPGSSGFRCVPDCLSDMSGMSDALPDTDNTASAMLAIGILMVIAGVVLMMIARWWHLRDRDDDR